MLGGGVLIFDDRPREGNAKRAVFDVSCGVKPTSSIINTASLS
jgi:hypothetical protein